jgi:preprotein translocase subunit SecD
VRLGTKSLMVGGLLVVLFMLLFYRLPGAIADLALFINVLFMMAVLAAFQATLTLPGIAGLVLTIGMAVDANIIIFERIREELGLGKQPAEAVGTGFSLAHLTILDANVTTLIAGFVLLQYGTGPVRGFAVTLIIGIITSYVTALWISRFFFGFFLNNDALAKSLFVPKRS